MKRVVGTGLVAMATAATLSAENWPQWRGPAKNGVSAETGLPLKWSTTENIAWKIAMPGRSGSTPIIWGETIFLNIGTADGSGDLELWALDRGGWPDSLEEAHRGRQSHRAQAEHVVTVAGDRRPDRVGDDRRRHPEGVRLQRQELWMRDIQKDYGRFGLNWGYASSPLLHAGDLFVQVLHGMKTDDPSYLLRIDGKSGKTLWRTERPTRAIEESPDSYTTPAALQVSKAPNGVEIVVTGGDVVTGTRPRERQGAVANGRPQPDQQPLQPHHRVPRRRGRCRDRAHSRAADARDQGRRPRRRRAHAPPVELRQRPRCPDAGQRRQAALHDHRSRRCLRTGARDRKRSSTGRSGSGPTATARHRSWPTIAST